MATTTSTTPVPITVHIVAYSILLVLIFGGGYLWHDTQVRDAQMLAQVVAVKSQQATVDTKAVASEVQATKALKQTVVQQDAQLKAAKTPAAQIALVNQDEGTHLAVQTPTPGSNPSVTPQPIIVVPATDLPILTQQAVNLKESEAQVDADKLTIAAQVEQIDSRDSTIKAQDIEITTLKGGSHLKRFFKAVKYVAIGVAVGYITAKTVN